LHTGAAYESDYQKAAAAAALQASFGRIVELAGKRAAAKAAELRQSQCADDTGRV